MAVYRGKIEKIERRFGEAIFGRGKSLKKRSYAPGQHGKKRKSRSVFAQQLLEKQKVKYMYGLLEKPFRTLFKKSSREKGLTGEVLLQKLETRLDNVVYRLGLAPTRKAARQIVSHKHILVNKKLVNIPSFSVSVGDILQIKAKSAFILDRAATKNIFEWLIWDDTTKSGKILSLPKRDQILENIDEQKIVEYYSR